MRPRSLSWVTFIVSLIALAANHAPAFAQIKFAKSTIRLTSATEPATATESAPAKEPTAARESELTIEAPTATEETITTNERPTQPVPRRAVRPANFVVPTSARPPAEAQPISRSRSHVSVYASASAQATLGKMPRPAPVQRSPAQALASQSTRTGGKPFQTIETEPAVSPYLNLYRTDLNPNAMPNYYALVRPQFEQREANRKQASDLQRLRTQLQNAAPPVAAPQQAANGASPNGMSMSARYMDTAQFYRHPHK